MARKSHPQVEYAVNDARGEERIFKTFDEAAGFAVNVALTGREHVYVDVLIYDKTGARFYGGYEAVEQYEEDPEASVYERFEIKVNPMGKVS